MINKIWSILMQGIDIPDHLCSRRTDTAAFDVNTDQLNVLNVLVPYKDDLFRPFYVDSLIRFVFDSEYKTRLSEFDPVNTYDKTTLLFPIPGVFCSDTPFTVIPFVDDGAYVIAGSGRMSFNCALYPGAHSISVNEGSPIPYTISNNLSSLIRLADNADIRLQGNLPGTTYYFTITCVARPSVLWTKVLSDLGAIEIVWHDVELKNEWENGKNWTERLAAVIVHAVENSAYGR